jgi:hypothetical protein
MVENLTILSLFLSLSLSLSTYTFCFYWILQEKVIAKGFCVCLLSYMTPYNIKEENEIKVRKMRLVRRKRKKEPKAKHVILSLAITLSFNSHFSNCRLFITMHS